MHLKRQNEEKDAQISALKRQKVEMQRQNEEFERKSVRLEGMKGGLVVMAGEVKIDQWQACLIIEQSNYWGKEKKLERFVRLCFVLLINIHNINSLIV